VYSRAPNFSEFLMGPKFIL